MTEAPPQGMRATSVDPAGRSNLARVLSIVHHLGPLSRAELTRMTGLNRSTIATLTAQLADLRLAYETAPEGTSSIGRPSPTVRADATTAALAINPEIDSITVGLVGLGGTVVRKVRHDTGRIPTAAEVTTISAGIVDGIRSDLGPTHRIVGIGVAVPGLARTDDGMVSYAPHLEWVDEPIARMLHEATGYPVWASNDATLGARAETLFGAGRGERDLIYLNGGASGIGGGIISGGALVGGVSGYAGELGHTLVNGEGTVCHCGARGCLETEVTRAPLLDALGLSPSESERLEDELVAAYREVGTVPERLRDEVERQLSFLGITLRSAVNIFNPGIIVLGGFLGSLYRVAPSALDSAVRGHAMIGPREDVRIARAQLGTDILMVGAAELAFSALLANPRALH